MVMRAVSVRQVAVDLGKRRILHGIDLAVDSGEWVNIIGPNGAGKTTLLRSLLGTVDHAGTIELGGEVIAKPIERARRLAYVPQSPVIPGGMYVSDYVLLGRTPHRGIFGRDSDTDCNVAMEVLARLDLEAFTNREVGSLSGGERQRVVLARALAQETDIVLLDEPTTALDLGHQQDVLDLVESLRHERGLTVIATLHDLTLAARYGDRIALLSGGRIVESGPPADVLTADTIAEHFGATVRIIDDPDGPVIVPTTGVAT
ncbi:MAG: ABC transporter ATP-binding protein [Actinomycetota bacterium]